MFASCGAPEEDGKGHALTGIANKRVWQYKWVGTDPAYGLLAHGGVRVLHKER